MEFLQNHLIIYHGNTGPRYISVLSVIVCNLCVIFILVLLIVCCELVSRLSLECLDSLKMKNIYIHKIFNS